ncbi:hypothetical protein PEBR_17352 [Penicillium brasilianum]|uniref:Uncharacterized protein n=1 Tax=Penicillium brasilianum TaxID=104259 RepID=A0A1S9RPH9_PENBI|nr:hypothetical protein PEBR_17352 [Penicillium brasilianum]
MWGSEDLPTGRSASVNERGKMAFGPHTCCEQLTQNANANVIKFTLGMFITPNRRPPINNSACRSPRVGGASPRHADTDTVRREQGRDDVGLSSVVSSPSQMPSGAGIVRERSWLLPGGAFGIFACNSSVNLVVHKSHATRLVCIGPLPILDGLRKIIEESEALKPPFPK